MENRLKHIAEKCLRGAEDNSMAFPQIVGTLMEEGFESYAIDYRRSNAIYYRPDGESIELPTHQYAASVAEAFDTKAIEASIREAQQLVPGTPTQVSARRSWQLDVQATSSRSPVDALSTSVAPPNFTSNTSPSRGKLHGRPHHRLCASKPSRSAVYRRPLGRGGSASSRARRRAVPIVDTSTPHWRHRAVGWDFSCLLSRYGCEADWLGREPVPVRGRHG